VLKRREFLTTSALALIGAARVVAQSPAFAQDTAGKTPTEPIIDIHQHLGYSGRPDDVFIAHQRATGATKTILLPAGRDTIAPSTHDGLANGLQAQARGNDECYEFARSHEAFLFGANEVPDRAGAIREIEQYLKRGAIVIGEQKFGVECDSPEMQTIYRLAGEHNVPVLMHWQYKMYNYGFERFHQMLEKFPRVKFIGHAQMWWANIDRNHTEPSVSYPKGPVTVGGLTDRYLSDYPNMYGDLSAGSGLNALTRDEDFARDFVRRHRDKLIFGSDCSCRDGGGPKCLGSQIIGAIRRLASDRQTERKLLYENATTVFRVK
jgi:predicted TIM-barrel fold metal-dependent hydrolase